jgi:hypothetical protein
MNITLQSASALVDRFEQLLADQLISVPRSLQTDADMLPLWRLLQAIRSGELQSSSQPDGLIIRSGGTQRWSQALTRLFGNALFYGVFGASSAFGQNPTISASPIPKSSTDSNCIG